MSGAIVTTVIAPLPFAMPTFFVAKPAATPYNHCVRVCDSGDRLRGLRCVLAAFCVALCSVAPDRAADVVQLPKVTVTAASPLVRIAGYHMAERRFAAAAVAYGGRIYIIGGVRGRKELLDSIECFDPRTGQSEIVAHLSTPRMWHRAVVLGDRIYVLGGSAPFGGPEHQLDEPDSPRDILALTSVEVFDPQTGETWQSDPLPHPVSGFGCVAADAKIYVIGGVGYHFAASDRDATTAALGDRSASDDAGYTPGVASAVMMYDPRVHTWRLGPPMPTSREAVAVLTADNRIVVAGGYKGQDPLACVEALDLTSQSWRRMADLCRRNSASAAVALERYLFLFGDARAPRDVLVYDLKGGDSEAYALGHGVGGQPAVVALERKIYLLGGRDAIAGTAHDRIEVFALKKDGNAPRN